MSPHDAAHGSHVLAPEPQAGSTRRRFIASVGVMALTTSPLAARAEIDTGEGVSFADGPRPLVRYPVKGR